MDAIEISKQLESFCSDYITALGEALDIAIRVNHKEYEAAFNLAMDGLSRGPVDLGLYSRRNPFQFGVLKEDRPRMLAEIKLLAESGGIPYNKMSPINQFFVTIQPYVFYCLEKYLPNDPGLREEARRLMNTRGFPRYLQENYGYPISQTIKGAFWIPKPFGFLTRLFGFGRRRGEAKRRIEELLETDQSNPKGGSDTMSEKVRIESNLILAFVSDLGIHAWSQFSVQAGKNPPTKKLNVKEEQEFRWTIAIVSKSIAKGFILAKHQPELAAALVEQMNREKPGSADELLGDMLSQYKLSLAKNLADRWESPKASDQGVLKSDLTRGRNEMSEQVRIESNSILDFVRELGEYASAGIYKLDPRKKLGAREVKQLQSMADIVSLAITRGIILTNYQPELAAALVEQMNQERAGFADEQLKEMLFVYKAFLYQKAMEKGWRPSGEPI